MPGDGPIGSKVARFCAPGSRWGLFQQYPPIPDGQAGCGLPESGHRVRRRGADM